LDSLPIVRKVLWESMRERETGGGAEGEKNLSAEDQRGGTSDGDSDGV
jgi:hypothetical protein